MKILLDINHPAHVHLFKNFIKYLKEKKHIVIITSREKDVTNRLLDFYNFDYVSLTKPKTNVVGMFLELLKRDYEILKLHKKYKFDVSFGTSVSIAHLSAITKVKSYSFNEDDDDVVPLYANITYPFTTKIIVPECIRYKKWRKKRILYPSYHELAYLHPNNFKADINIIKKYGLEPKKYIIIRHSALSAHHDFAAKGISESIMIDIYNIIKNYPLLYIQESKKSNKIEPWDMHHILAFTKLLISDSQTMSVEAAVLGVPSIRYNSFVGRASILNELEDVYGLTYGYKISQKTLLLNKIKELHFSKNLSAEWLKRRQRMLSNKIDFNKWMINFFEKEINK